MTFWHIWLALFGAIVVGALLQVCVGEPREGDQREVGRRCVTLWRRLICR